MRVRVLPARIGLRAKPKPLRDWTLRSQIVAGVLTLFVILSGTIGVFTELALKQSLTSRLDSQLTAASRRPRQIQGGFDAAGTTGANPGGAGLPNGTYGQALLPFGSSVNQIGAYFGAGGQSGFVARDPAPNSDPSSARLTLSDTVLDELKNIAPDGKPRTVTLRGLGTYRVLASSFTTAEQVKITYVAGLPLKTVNDTVTKLILVIGVLTLAGLVIAGLLCTLLVRLALRPLNRVTATASRVAEMPLDEGEVALAVRVSDPNPNTEVGQVGVALNRMLENVSEALNARHRSETNVRHFVADASHELRTPLAAIRGYAELTRRSREQAPADIAHAMGRVESEAKRMTALVEDLLLLARLDAGRSLDEVEVDLTSLAVDVLSDAHIAGPAHHWRLSVPDEPVIVIGDPARLHQVVANLLANARTHTPAGTRVHMDLAIEGSSAVLKVSDDGPGIAPELVDQIFERFSRGEESRSRAAGSTGLGLAIVTAVVGAHGGTITVTSRPGQTIFTVVLPSLGRRQASAQTSTSLQDQTLSL